jgi:hypothetical protein
MKQLSLAACILCVLVACNSATTSSNKNDTTASTSDSTAMNTNVEYAYPVGYSSDWSIGDPKYAQMVLELWKDYDNNTFDNHKDYFADSVTMDLAGGTSLVNVSRDSALNNVKRYRSSLKNAVSSVEVLTALKPKGKDETWACVWGKEVDTYNNGKMDSIYLNENWEFNKDGKIIYMAQFQATPAKPAKK